LTRVKFLNGLYKFLGSLKLAVISLAAIAAVLAVATFYESNHGTPAVQRHVYQAWWFTTLLTLLAINVAVAALHRYPWRGHLIGFAITHLGIVVLLVGCGAGFHLGTEGMVDLRVGEPPRQTARTDLEALTVTIPELGLREQTTIHAKRTGALKPREFAVGNALRVHLEKIVPNTQIETVVRTDGPVENPAIKFVLRSEMMGQSISDWLVARDPEHDAAHFGVATIRFIEAPDAEHLALLLADPKSDELRAEKPTLNVKIGEQSAEFDIASNVEKHLTADSLPEISVHIVGYWPDFRLDARNQPVSISDEPNNPAALVIVRSGDQEERHFVFARADMPPIVRPVVGEPIDARVRLLAPLAAAPRASALTVVLAPDGKLHFAATTREKFSSGTLEIGEKITPGWADFEFSVEQFEPKAVIEHKIVAAPDAGNANFPALAVNLDDGARQISRWIRFGQPEIVEMNGKTVHLMYTWQMFRLPMSVMLEDFIIERDEGSTRVAGWTSKVRFEDPAHGTVKHASIWMNNPAWFGGWKFSQASWNPNDLQYSALQVKYNPHWITALTWLGAALIVGGIAAMFYLRPRPQGKRRNG
jgi:hypothetical protein